MTVGRATFAFGTALSVVTPELKPVPVSTVPPTEVSVLPDQNTDALCKYPPVSATYTLPSLSAAMPSREAAILPDRATAYDSTVVTTPPRVTERTVPLSDIESVTYAMPLASTATPMGLLNVAAGPVPSSCPGAELPASVDTTPVGVTIRTALFNRSAT